MAEGFARHLGSGVVNAASSGLAPASSIARETKEAMAEKGIDLSAQFPKEFDAREAAQHDVVVNISGFLLPAFRGPVILEWEIDDPFGEPIDFHRRVRDEIEERIKELIERIQTNGPWVGADPVGQRIAAMPTRRPRLWQRFTKWR